MRLLVISQRRPHNTSAKLMSDCQTKLKQFEEAFSVETVLGIIH